MASMAVVLMVGGAFILLIATVFLILTQPEE